jgi:succinate dehydrogenase / fumarate reductase cytochrome b subunit
MPRPISPHLQIYRWQIGNSLSILHRLTGIALAFGLFALCYWLVALAGGQRSYAVAVKLLASPLGLLGLIGWTFAFTYHLLNGVRHLFWDAGYGFERTQRHASGWFAVLGALVLTLAVWLLIWHASP